MRFIPEVRPPLNDQGPRPWALGWVVWIGAKEALPLSVACVWGLSVRDEELRDVMPPCQCHQLLLGYQRRIRRGRGEGRAALSVQRLISAVSIPILWRNALQTKPTVHLGTSMASERGWRRQSEGNIPVG